MFLLEPLKGFMYLVFVITALVCNIDRGFLFRGGFGMWGVDHEEGGGVSGEFDEVEGEDCNWGEARRVRGFKEVDDGGDGVGLVDTGQDSELRVRFESLYGPVLVWKELHFGSAQDTQDGLGRHCHHHNRNEHHCKCFIFYHLQIIVKRVLYSVPLCLFTNMNFCT